MRKIALLLFVSAFLICVCGCKNIIIGGSGEVGGVHGGGSVVIPVPNQGK